MVVFLLITFDIKVSYELYAEASLQFLLRSIRNWLLDLGFSLVEEAQDSDCMRTPADDSAATVAIAECVRLLWFIRFSSTFYGQRELALAQTLSVASKRVL